MGPEKAGSGGHVNPKQVLLDLAGENLHDIFFRFIGAELC